MSDYKPYWNDGTKPDDDHPRAGWYIELDEDGDKTVFGPFATEQHAEMFAVKSQAMDD